MSPNCIPKSMVVGLSISELWHFNSGHLGQNRAKNEVFGTQKSEYHRKKFFLGGIDRSSYQGIIFGRRRFWAKRCGSQSRIYKISPFYKMGLPAAPRRLRNQRFLRLPRVARPCRGQLGHVRAEHRTEESLIHPKPPFPPSPRP